MSGSAFDQVNLQVINHDPCPWETCAEACLPQICLLCMGLSTTLFPQGPEIKPSMEVETICHYLIGRRKIFNLNIVLVLGVWISVHHLGVAKINRILHQPPLGPRDRAGEEQARLAPEFHLPQSQRNENGCAISQAGHKAGGHG